jgi:hypothetical protein
VIAQELLGPAVLVLYVGLMVGFALLGRRWPAVFRPLHGLEALGAAIERAVEAGGRVHLSLGTGSVTGADSAPAFAGLAMLSRVAAATAMSDKPVVVTAGDAAMAVLAQDTLRTAYDRARAPDRFQPTSGRMLAPTPFSYAAALPTVWRTRRLRPHAGGVVRERGRSCGGFRRGEAFVLAGTDDISRRHCLRDGRTP